jgi:hypothetical protein
MTHYRRTVIVDPDESRLLSLEVILAAVYPLSREFLPHIAVLFRGKNLKLWRRSLRERNVSAQPPPLAGAPVVSQFPVGP